MKSRETGDVLKSACLPLLYVVEVVRERILDVVGGRGRRVI